MLEDELLEEDEVVRASVEDDVVHEDEDDELEDVELEEDELEDVDCDEGVLVEQLEVDDEDELDVDELEELEASSSCRPIRYKSYTMSPPLAPTRIMCDEPSSTSNASSSGWCSSRSPPALSADPSATVNCGTHVA